MKVEIIRANTESLGLNVTCMTAFNSPKTLRDYFKNAHGTSCGIAGIAIIHDDEGMHLFKFYYSFIGDDGDIKHVEGSNLPNLMLEQYRRALKSLIPAHGLEYISDLEQY